MMDGERQTQRLRVRRPTREDRDAYLSHFTQEPVERWLRPPPLARFDVDQVESLLFDDCRHWDEHGFGPWVLDDVASGEFAGRGGLAWASVDGALEIELPWSIEPRLHGTGLATEAAVAALHWAAELGFDEVIALILPANRASQRVAEKAGMNRAGSCEHAGLEHWVYRRPLLPGVA